MLMSHPESARERSLHERAWTLGPVYPKRKVGSSQRETRTTVNIPSALGGVFSVWPEWVQTHRLCPCQPSLVHRLRVRSSLSG